MDAVSNRRPLAINIAFGAASAHCHDCGARHVGMCDALDDADLAFLSRVAQRVSIAAGKMFIEEGDPAAHFYNINAGTVRVFKSLSDGRRHITGFMGVGSFLGLDVSGSYAFSAESLAEVELCRFNRKALTDVFAEFPALERRLLELTAHELTAAHDQMLLLGRKTAQERVASFLVTWAERAVHCPAGTGVKPGTMLHLPMTRTDLADYLGLTIETVSRAVGALKKSGLIELDTPQTIRLRNPAGLSDLAAGNG